MSPLTLRLLGPPQLERDGAPLHVTRRRTLAFTIYLAVSGETHHRDHLAAFFWPELDRTSARADLRRTIYQVHQLLGAEWLEAEDELLRFRRNDDCWIDVEAFRQLLASASQATRNAPDAQGLQQLAEAVALYRNDFLAGFSLPDSPAFDDWQFFQGETLRGELAAALERLVEGHAAQDAYPAAIGYARRWLALDPLHEPVHRWLMQLYAWSDQQAAALRQYQQCVQVLSEELGTTPAPATEQLYRAIRTRRLAPLPTHGPQPVGHADDAGEPSAPREDDIRIVTVVSVGLTETTAGTEQIARDALLPTSDPLAVHPLHVDVLNRAAEASAQLRELAQGIGARLGGQVEQVVGEDILLLFGTVRVHEDDAERAVRAAWTLRQRAQQAELSVHIGVSTGMVYCRHSPAGEVAVLGPTVDGATRLRNRARTGEILVHRNTYLATRGIFLYAPQLVSLPGMAEPSRAYRVEQLRRQPQKARGIEGVRAALVGRDGELALLRAALAKVQRGQGQIVVLTGAAGVGKSRLVDELKAYAGVAQPLAERAGTHPGDQSPNGASPPLWLEGRGVEFAGAVGYWLFADLLRGYMGIAPGKQPVALDQALTTMLHDLERAGHLSAAAVAEMAPLLARLLSISFVNGWDQQLRDLAPQQLHRRMTQAVVQWIAALTHEQAVVLLFEDLHWADAHSLDLIVALLDLLPHHRLLLLCLYRPEQARADHQLATMAQKNYSDQLTTIGLRELSSAESRRLVASLLAFDRLPGDVRDPLLAKAAGNPFFLEEIVRSLIDSGVLYRDGDSWRAQATAAVMPIPESLQSFILSRVDHLAADARLVLRMASVLGRLFPYQIVATMVPAGLDLDGALAQLTAQAFIYRERTVPEVEYSFQHVLLRDAVYQDLPSARRVAFHEEAARALEALHAHNLQPVMEQLAHHYAEAAVAEKAIPYLLQAGQKAQDTYANAAALTYFQRAQHYLRTQTTPDPRQQLAVLDGIGGVYTTLGDLQQGESYLRQAIALAQRLDLPTVDQIRRYFPLCHLLGWHGHNDAVLTLADEGLALLGADLTQPEAVMLIALKSDVYFNRGQRRAAMASIAQIIHILPQLGYMRQLQSAYNMVAMWSRYTKQIDRGFALLRAVEENALTQRDLWTVGYLHGWPVLFLYETIGDLEQTFASLQRVEEIAALTSDELLHIQACTYRGVAHGWCAGNWEVAATYAREVIRLSEAAHVPRKSIFAYVTWGLAHYSRRAWGDAVATLEVARETALAQQFRADCARRGDIGLAWSYLHLGRRDDAATLFRSVVAEEEADIESLHLITCALAGLAAASCDPQTFQRHCTVIEERRAGSNALPALQWQAQPAECAQEMAQYALRLPNSDAELVDQGWQWVDPAGTGAYFFTQGLTIAVANYRDLWLNNLGAPRLLRPTSGPVVLETRCTAGGADPGGADRPPLGGLLLWKDPANYLRLTWNTHAPGEINLLGCIHNRDLLLGRSALPGMEGVFLRLERIQHQVRALYSADGEQWFHVGTVTFPVADPVQIGLVSIGFIPRYVYPGSYASGTAIRFAQRFNP